MSAPKRAERPLSPFMIGPYYRPQMTSISSIMVRITGIATLGTIFLLVAWLLAAATSPAAFDCIDWLLTSVVGDVLLVLAVWAIWYHALGRLRHLIWDLGYFVEIRANEVMGLGMFIGATVLTLITVLVV
ncbi:succinate dehydrogenase, cytochrome b556 subunit [Pseudogemmobacter humi]|uniref:Succinate dehydrogenase cytochrome b556 subunit n=1 Tax=Pseudogemmobacter humi TaxID=2483812 RepID=A0A3P5X1X6_9RHOB|nr:succinate dehydrogenase, cytochrome b556 subunit [Pseudogemmobacter humi]VDC25250.1 succinate dehydrogenase cytochrome b556 large membrane subunit [Pseudogemmobacter humi]